MWRAIYRVPGLLLVTVLAHGGNWLSRLFVRPFSQKTHVRLRNRCFRFWGRGLAWCLNMRVSVEGTPPSGRFFMVSNHVSYLDIGLLGIFVDAAFIAKADLRGWPFLGWVFDTADSIFVDRSKKRDILRVMEKVDAKLDEGYGILLFPEGTSGKGDALLRFKPSILQFAVERQAPVHFATLEYRTREGEMPPSRGVCWWGDEPFFPHFKRLVTLSGMDAIVRFGDAPVIEGDRKLLSQKLHSEMEAIFHPMP